MKKHMLAKRMGAIALCAVLSTGLLSATAAAQGKDVTAYLSPDLSIVVDGSYRTFYNAVGQEVHPILYGGTTYLPIRAIGELMGKNVNWSQSTLTVSLAGDRPNGSVTGTRILQPRHRRFRLPSGRTLPFWWTMSVRPSLTPTAIPYTPCFTAARSICRCGALEN